MKIILHIGMGKTGTSSIQRALQLNQAGLATQNATYLGMWFDIIDPAFKGLKNQANFFALSADDMRSAAETLFAKLQQRETASGVKTFIVSNESFAGKAKVFEPFLQRLQDLGVEIQLIAYLRNPRDWLPSAYVQWGIRHKQEPGPIQPFAVKARRLVNWYQGPLEWSVSAGALLELRPYDEAGDIVLDFARAIGLRLAPLPERVLERGDEAEIVLRALFNDKIAPAVLPDVFDTAVFPSLGKVRKIEDVVDLCFDYSEVDGIVAENAALFDRLTLASGFDPRLQGKPGPAQTRPHDVKDRLIDAMLDVVLTQARRLTRLERIVARLDQDNTPNPDALPKGPRIGPK